MDNIDWKEILGSVSSIISIANFLYFIVGIVFTYALTVTIRSRYRRGLRKILGISSVKARRGKYWVTTPAYHYNIYNYQADLIMQNEAVLQERIAHILGDLRCECIKFGKKEPEMGASEVELYNEIHIGGIVSNQNTITYCKHYLKGFVTLEITADDKDILKNENVEGFEGLVKIGEKSGIRYQSSAGDAFIDYTDGTTDFAILIKLTPEILTPEFPRNKKTVHLLWGFQLPGTEQAVHYLIEHCEDIYKKHKNKSYCLVIPYDRPGKKLLEHQLHDLTDDMLHYVRNASGTVTY